MISFREGQTKIFFGKNKIELSLFLGYLDFHIIYSIDNKSGYIDKFVRVVTFENVYDFEILKNISTNNFEDDLVVIKYFENGGYVYDKKNF